MEYYIAYHSNGRFPGERRSATRIERAGMSVSGEQVYSNAQGMALCCGRLRNGYQLSNELNADDGASAAQLAMMAYARWGDDYARHLQGPVLSCICDTERDRMLVSRDRMGEISAFYARRGGEAALSDHPDALLAAGIAEPVMDRDGLCELFGLGPACTPGRTPLRDIKSVRMGRTMIFERQSVQETRYFELPNAISEVDPEAAAVQVRALLEQAIDDIAPLRPGCMLSGGIDSTALTALVAARMPGVKSFSVDYQDNARDFIANAFRPEMDAPYARMAAEHLRTRHTTIVLRQDDLAGTIDEAQAARGFPGMADIDSSLLLFARAIGRQVGHVVSGECGDEVFGGYPWFQGDGRAHGEAFPWSGSIHLRNGILKPAVREKIGLPAYVRGAYHEAMASYDVSNVPPAERDLFRLQRLCFDFFMPNLQERASKMCAAAGIQVYTPLCDDRLVSAVYAMPWRVKRMGGISKGLYRAAVRDLLPEKLLQRKKSPYPKTCSADYTAEIRRRMGVLLRDTSAPLWRAVDAERVAQIASGALSPADAPWYGQLMAGPQMLAYLLQVNDWMTQNRIEIDI